MLTGKRGQSIVEFLPAVLIFMLVTTSAMAFFRTLRHATIKQEVVRNMAFAKIGNSGTLTTPGDHVRQAAPTYQGSQMGELAIQNAPQGGRKVAGVQAGPNTFVHGNSRCFRILPNETTTSVNLSGIYGMGQLVSVPFTTTSVVYRGALGQRVGALCGP